MKLKQEDIKNKINLFSGRNCVRQMKRKIILIIILLILILSGCSGFSKHLHFGTYTGGLYEVENVEDN